MKEFVLIFRSEALPEERFNPDQMQEIMKQWQNWMGGIAAQDKLASTGNRLGGEGKTLKPGNLVINGPYVEIKEMISGYIIIRANSLDDATEIAKDCPMLVGGGGSVEIRDVVPMNV